MINFTHYAVILLLYLFTYLPAVIRYSTHYITYLLHPSSTSHPHSASIHETFTHEK